MVDWDGAGYARVSALQRAMVDEALSGLTLSGDEAVLDVGCGDGYLTHRLTALVPRGWVVGVDASARMISAARAAADAASYAVADARHLPFDARFDVVTSFNALHWVPEQHQALGRLAAALRPGGRAVIQVVCAGPRTSLESVAMQVTAAPRWAGSFAGFTAPFVHVDPAGYADLAAVAGLHADRVTVTDRHWDFGSREPLTRWCAVGLSAWTDRLPADLRADFVGDTVRGYEDVTGQPGLFRFMQLRAELSR
ncbi:methyltransferase domain-containing protein [Mycobacterium sp. MYCO198283]|uniref:class I SAM-dependent methyltransferase n=1 Tax=Mycobacterium sp. MYCO198283 TaxID=2883505 RepID=UPI001E565BDA|nr:class I SAM-dependent methyltransferase [Mycobacterium sp. MYCO198283]MCG5433248.1 methyltransferase domain-containing protein [Mycobacterium sp. MYCO198283]